MQVWLNIQRQDNTRTGFRDLCDALYIGDGGQWRTFVNTVINSRVVIKSKHVFTMLTLTDSQIGRLKIIYLLHFVKSDSLNDTHEQCNIIPHTHMTE